MLVLLSEISFSNLLMFNIDKNSFIQFNFNNSKFQLEVQIVITLSSRITLSLDFSHQSLWE